MHIPVQKQRHVPVHVPVERPIEVPPSLLGGIFFGVENLVAKKPSKNQGIFCLECFFCQKNIQHPRNLLISPLGFFCSDWLIRLRFTSFKNVVWTEVETERKTEKSWGECHWNLGEGDWCASGKTGGSATGLALTSGANVSFFFWSLELLFFWVLGWY